MIHRVEARAHSKATRETVWRLVSNGADWSTWGAWRETSLEREGNPPPDGVGAVRVLVSERRGPTGRPIVSKEEVMVYRPPERLEYRLLQGLHLRSYRGTIVLDEASGGGTDIIWSSRFAGKLPLTGGFLRRALQSFTQDAAERLAREAERRS